MATYIILSKLAANAMEDPSQFRKLAENVSKRIKEQCPRVRWKESYALMGRFDVVDIVEADNPAEVEKAPCSSVATATRRRRRCTRRRGRISSAPCRSPKLSDISCQRSASGAPHAAKCRRAPATAPARARLQTSSSMAT